MICGTEVRSRRRSWSGVIVAVLVIGTFLYCDAKERKNSSPKHGKKYRSVMEAAAAAAMEDADSRSTRTLANEMMELYIPDVPSSESNYTQCQEGYLEVFAIPHLIKVSDVSTAKTGMYLRRPLIRVDYDFVIKCVDSTRDMQLFTNVKNIFECADIVFVAGYNSFLFEDGNCTGSTAWFHHIVEPCAENDPTAITHYMLTEQIFPFHALNPIITITSFDATLSTLTTHWISDDPCDQIVSYQITKRGLTVDLDITTSSYTIGSLPACTDVEVFVKAFGDDGTEIARDIKIGRTADIVPILNVGDSVPGHGIATITFSLIDDCHVVSSVAANDHGGAMVPASSSSITVTVPDCSKAEAVPLIMMDDDNNTVGSLVTATVSALVETPTIMFGAASTTETTISQPYTVRDTCVVPLVESVNVYVDDVYHSVQTDIPTGIIELSGLTRCTGYDIALIPLNSDGNVIQAPEASTFVLTSSTPPSVSLTSVLPARRSVELTWFTFDPCKLISRYVLYWSGEEDSPTTFPVTFREHLKTNLQSCHSYNFTLVTVDKNNQQLTSTKESTRTLDREASILVIATPVTHSTVTVRYAFTDICILATTAVLTVTDGIETHNAEVHPTARSITIQSLTPCRDYSYTLVLKDASGNDVSNVEAGTFTTATGPPTSINLLSAIKKTIYEVDLSWFLDNTCGVPLDFEMSCGLATAKTSYPNDTFTVSSVLAGCTATSCTITVTSPSYPDYAETSVVDITDPTSDGGTYTLTEFGCFYHDDSGSFSGTFSDLVTKCSSLGASPFEPDTTYLVEEIGVLLKNTVGLGRATYYVNLERVSSDYNWRRRNVAFPPSDPGWVPQSFWPLGAEQGECGAYTSADSTLGYEVRGIDCTEQLPALCYKSFLFQE